MQPIQLTIENILLVGSLLLFISIIAGKTSYRFGVPTLLLFLGIGMFAGSDGPIGISFSDPKIAQFIGIVSLNVILFSGGLDTSWSSVKPIVKEGLVLSTVGVLLTALTLGTFVYYITDFDFYESMLLGSIVSSTDAAAVFSILRSKNLALKTNLRPTLELESGSNDPMAYVLTIMFLTLVVHKDQSIMTIIPIFFQQMILGGILGFVFGKLSKFIINRIKLDFEGLYPALVIALMFMTFSATDVIGGNGFLAIYICAIYLGNQDLMHKSTILKMYDGLAWLMQIILFLTLGLLVFPSKIIPHIGIGLLISVFLILVSRPVSVFLSLIFFKMQLRRRLYISWVGLRGAVPIVFATYPLIKGFELKEKYGTDELLTKADIIFSIVFFISVTSILIQGTTLSVIAQWLHVALPKNVKPVSEIDKILSDLKKTYLKEIKILSDFHAVGKRIIDLKLPRSAFISIIKRDNEYVRPGGATQIEVNDILVMLADSEEDFAKIDECLRNQKLIEDHS